MSQFERTNQACDRVTVLVTSWFDDSTQSWRASAPRYTFVAGITDTAEIRCDSRSQAIDAVVNVLKRHFSELTPTQK